MRLAFRAAPALDSPTLAVDVPRREGSPLLHEVSYFFPGYGINATTGHGELDGGADSGSLTWREGITRAEDAILDDYLVAARHAGATGVRWLRPGCSGSLRP